MDKKSKIIACSVGAILSVGGVGYGVYSNAQYQQTMKIAAKQTRKEKAKEAAETNQVEALQKKFVIADGNSEKILSALTK